MTGRDAVPARVRGGFVGALCGAGTLAAHGIAGGTIPGGAAVVVLVLACAAVGLIARMRCRQTVARLALLLAAGQATGHLLLAASCHDHGAAISARMVAAHGVASLVGALLVAAAERLARLVGSAPGWIARLLTGPGVTADVVAIPSIVFRTPLTVRLHAAGPATRRGPPAFAAV